MTQQYQVLARKYRPKNFHELVGQTHVSQALINAIDYNRLHHAYLFTGTRGVGKTTIARILSKCLNCDTGITSTPCGVCDNCVAIDQGRFIDLIEIDAASRTKVEDTRELLDNVPYAPSQGRYKVYLIDEVHMLSTHSFNALLKTLEEPPEHVKFLLATTDPQKLPVTIISRCLQFVLRPLPQTLLSEHLAKVLTQEQVHFTQPALWQLASAAKGSVRDAMSLTDQAIAFGQGALDDETVNAMLGLIDAADLVRLITDIYHHDTVAVAAHIEQMRAQMVDASSMFDGLAELLHQLALTQLLPEVALNVNEAQAQTINELAQRISPDVLQLYYEIVVQAREGIKLASTPMQALEMCILRLLAFRPLPTDEVLTSSIARDGKTTPVVSSIVSSQQDSTSYDIDHENTYEPSYEEQDSENASVENQSEHEAMPDHKQNIENENAEVANPPVATVTEPESVVEPKIAVVAETESIAEIEPTTELEPIPNQGQGIGNEAVDTPDLTLETVAETEMEATVELEPSADLEAIIEPDTTEDLQQTNSHSHTQHNSQLALDDPRSLLRCAPQELAGEWTPEKWDYWLQTAREEDVLASDELALARQGTMVGLCDGRSTFLTNIDSKHLQATFQQLAAKLKQQFTQADISLEIDDSAQRTADKTPESRQKLRLEQAAQSAQELLLASPVMRYLTERGEGKMGKVKLT
ncbi:DNA polymerase III subunit gamma/tau [Psychrobacter sp. 1Y11]|uniref:DNA polymerase III subunit gamma/tau n=1 Tax=Psychrobacter sp. 1Y11 TaxID=3457446 RepID=UPI003FD128E9